VCRRAGRSPRGVIKGRRDLDNGFLTKRKGEWGPASDKSHGIHSSAGDSQAQGGIGRTNCIGGSSLCWGANYGVKIVIIMEQVN